MSSRQARAVSLRVCNAPCTMQALLSKACCVPTAVLSSSLRSNRVLTGTAAPQPTLPGPAGARPVLQGLLAASRAVWDVSCAAASCSCLGCHPACWQQQPTSNVFLVYKTCYVPCKHERDSWLTSPARAVHPLCGACEKRYSFSHTAQGVYQTYI